MNTQTRNKLAFLANIKQNYPGLYRAAINAGQNRGLSGLGATVEEMIAAQNAGTDFPNPLATSSTSSTIVDTPWYQSLINSTLDTIKQIAPVWVSTKQASTCIQVNAERAKSGLAPIDCAAGGLAPQVSVGVSPDVKMMMYIGLGIGAIYLLMRGLGKRK